MSDNSLGDGASRIVALTAQIVSAYLTKNPVSADGIASLIGQTGEVLSGLARGEGVPVKEELTPAVPIEQSVTRTHIICLENGKKFKMLKRHLAEVHGLTPDAYRQKWGLPPDYPMVAPEYAQRRSEFARNSGLGKR